MLAVLRRSLFPALALAGCLALLVAEFLDLYSIHVITVTVETGTVGGHHLYALAIVAVAAAAMILGAVRGGSRPAALALVALAVLALVIVLAVDLPVVDDTGLYGRDYEQARAQAETGFYVETAGAVLLLLGAVGLAVLGAGGARATGRRRRAPEAEPAASPGA
jgi:hypothetical protein